MKAIIMAGGKGTRLRPITCELPKPMVPIVNMPLMEHLILLLKNHGIIDIGVTLMYLPQKIKNYFGDGTKWGVRLTYFEEETPRGTAGSLLGASTFLDDTFVVLSGDCITDLDLTEAIAYHRSKKVIATLVLTTVRYPQSFGIVSTSNCNYITGFLEKPSRGEVFSDLVNTGIYILEPNILAYIEAGKTFDFSRDLFPKLMNKGVMLLGYITYRYWSDVGTLEAYINTQVDYLDQKLNTFLIKKHPRNNISIGPSTIIEPTAKINGPCVIGSNCYIGHRVVIDQYTVIGDNSFIEDRAYIKRSILLNNCTIGYGCELRGSVLGTRVRLMQYVSCYENVAIGEECVLHEHSIIKQNMKIWPGKTIHSLSVVDRNIIWASQYRPDIFHSGGMSGTINVDITPEFASRLGSAYGSVIGQGRGVVVSSDEFNTSNLFKHAFISGLMSVGVHVYHFCKMSVPMSRQAVHMLQAAGGVHVKRSNDSPEKLEVDFFDEKGANADYDLGKNIESVFYKEDFLRCRARSIPAINDIYDFYLDYIDYLKTRVDMECIRQNTPSILIASNGESMLSFIHNIFKQLGILVGGEILIKYMDTKSIRNVEHFFHADLTAFVDRSGEKLVLIDSKGQEIDEDLFFLFTSFILLHSVPRCNIVAPLKITYQLENMAAKCGGTVKRVNSSKHAILKEMMKTNVYTDTINQYMLQYDAVASLIKIIEYLCKNQTTLNNLIELLPDYHIGHTAILCPFEQIGKVMRVLLLDKNAYRHLFGGIKVIFKTVWVLVTPDCQKPILHLYSEGSTRQETDKFLHLYSRKLKKIISHH